MKDLSNLLKESRYPSLVDLLIAAADQLDNSLLNISSNCSSGNYTLDEIAEQIDDLREKIVRSEQKGVKCKETQILREINETPDDVLEELSNYVIDSH